MIARPVTCFHSSAEAALYQSLMFLLALQFSNQLGWLLVGRRESACESKINLPSKGWILKSRNFKWSQNYYWHLLWLEFTRERRCVIVEGKKGENFSFKDGKLEFLWYSALQLSMSWWLGWSIEKISKIMDYKWYRKAFCHITKTFY